MCYSFIIYIVTQYCAAVELDRNGNGSSVVYTKTFELDRYEIHGSMIGVSLLYLYELHLT